MFRCNGINLDNLQDNGWFNQDPQNLKEGYGYNLGIIGTFSFQAHSSHSWLKCGNICQIYTIDLCYCLKYISSNYTKYSLLDPSWGKPYNLTTVNEITTISASWGSVSYSVPCCIINVFLNNQLFKIQYRPYFLSARSL